MGMFKYKKYRFSNNMLPIGLTIVNAIYTPKYVATPLPPLNL